MHPLYKTGAVLVHGAVLASSAAALYGAGDLNSSKAGVYEVADNSQRINLENAIIAVTDPYFCYKDNFKDPTVKELASLTDVDNAPVFTCEELFAYNTIGGSFEFAKELLSMKDSSGNSQFIGRDIFAYKEAGGTIEYAKKFLSATDSEGRNIFSGAQLAQLYSLNISMPEALGFNDTSKPNALLIYPASDNNPDVYGRYIGGSFRDSNHLNFFNELKKVYDLKVVVASEEDDFYTHLFSPAEFEFLLLAGHGSASSLTLSIKDSRILQEKENEKRDIDISDQELKNYFQNLAPQAVIFLYSCSTGEGSDNATNLANTIAKWARGRKVIAPKEVLGTSRVAINPFYPFDATLTDYNTGKRDITYKVLFDK